MKWFFVLSFLFSLLPAHPATADVFTNGLTPTGVFAGNTSNCSFAADAGQLYATGWGQGSALDVYHATLAALPTPNWPETIVSWYFQTYYPAVNEFSYYSGGLAWNVGLYEQAIRDGDAVVLVLYNQDYTQGHAISSWGYETDAAGQLVGLYLVNSNLDYAPLFEVGVVGGQISWQDWHIWYFTELDPMPADGGDRLLLSPPMTPVPAPVPLPPSLYCLAAGLVAMAISGRSGRRA